MNNTIMIPQRQLADSGMAFSVAGLGTVKIGRNSGVKYPEAFQLPDDSTVRLLLDNARECGINWLDTAPAYGSSEKRLGKIIHRDEWYIASKAGEEFTHSCSYFDFSSKHITASAERSLSRLRTDRLDLLLLHSDGNDLDIIYHTDALEALSRLKQQGKIRAFGMSCKTTAGATAALPYCDALMLTLNPTYPDNIPVIQLAAKQKKAVIVKKGFGSGHLVQQYGIPELCNYLFKEPITAVVLGTINPEHLRSNCRAIARAVCQHTV